MTDASVIIGPVRHPTNRDYQHEGSIHDDATAAMLGFRGGTVAGSSHLDSFVPLLLEAFGPAWFERGSLSVYFRHATTDGEPVVSYVRRPPGGILDDVLVDAWAVTPEGVIVGEGTAGLGRPDGPTALRGRDLRHDPSSARILAGLQQGDAFGPRRHRLDGAAVAERNAVGLISAALDWYAGPSPWGGPVAPPSAVVNLVADVAAAEILPRVGPAVGLWGALEISFVGGPVHLDTDYDVRVEVAAIADTPRTEVLWYDAVAAREGGDVVRARVMTRFVKPS